MVIQEKLEGRVADWMEKVSDEQYKAACPPERDLNMA
jgi:hypothetical protein